MFSLFSKSNTATNFEACQPRIKNRDLPWQLQQPPLSQRLKRKIFEFLGMIFIISMFLFVVIMSFGDGTSAKRALVNFSIEDTWQATVALKQKIVNDKVDTKEKIATADK